MNANISSYVLSQKSLGCRLVETLLRKGAIHPVASTYGAEKNGLVSSTSECLILFNEEIDE
jgi:hypothetical protein